MVLMMTIYVKVFLGYTVSALILELRLMEQSGESAEGSTEAAERPQRPMERFGDRRKQSAEVAERSAAGKKRSAMDEECSGGSAKPSTAPSSVP
jgi:hypothetical protein